jgi:predicted permease
MRRLFRRLHYLIHHRQVTADLAEELESHRALKQHELERAGMASEDASCASRRALGNMTLAADDARAVWIAPWLDGVRQDLRYGARSLARQPGFSVTAFLILGLAIGLNTTLATMFTTMYWRPWPVANPGEVVQIVVQDSAGVSSEFPDSRYRNFADHARLTAVVATSCGHDSRIEGCRVAFGQEPITAEFVSGNYFRALTIGMALGRGFLDDEDRVAAPVLVAIISHHLWERAFDSDANIIGKTVRLDDEPFTIVGVAARGFRGTALLRRDVWLPLASGRLVRPTSRGVNFVELGGRLRSGVSREQAQAELQSLYPAHDPNTLQPRQIMLVGTSAFARPNDRQEGYVFFAVVFTGVLLVLLLACANVGNLLLARTLARSREIAVRVSVGASRSRVVRQLLTESLVLAGTSAIVGIWIAWVLPTYVVDLGMQASDAAGHVAFEVRPNLAVLTFTAGLVVLTCVACGLAPALHVTRPSADTLKDHSRRALGRFPLRSVLLSVQVAVSVILLVAAGLLVRGIQHAHGRHLGFAVDGVTVVSFEPPVSYDTARIQALSNQLVDAIEALPDSRLFGIATAAPLGDRFRTLVRLPDRESTFAVVSHLRVSRGYFDVLRIPIVAGRNFEPANDADGVLINESLARRYWPGENPIGKTIVAGPRESLATPRRVIGVVGHDDTEGQTHRLEPVRPRLYEATSGPRAADGVLPGDDDRHMADVLLPANAAGASQIVAGLASGLDPRLRVNTTPLSANLERRLSESRFTAMLAGTLGLVALALSTIGVFGVFAYVVRQQTHEIGIRVALGARSAHVIRAVVGLGARPLALGLATGLVGAVGAGQLLRSNLFGLSPLDPIAYVGVAALLAGAAVAAVSVPAWRATRIDPVSALKSESS